MGARSSLTAALLIVLFVYAAAETLSINWSGDLRATSNLQFGSNDMLAEDPSFSTGAGAHQPLLASLGFKFIRIHSGGLVEKWTSSSTKTWDTTKIKAVYDAYAAAYPGGGLTIMQNIPHWPSWMSTANPLPSTLWGQYATLCADLVRIINIQQGRGVKYWEPINEEDDAFSPVSTLYDMWNQVAAAMKQVDPTIIVGGLASDYARPGGASDFVSAAAGKAGFVSWHSYFTDDATTHSTDELTNAAVNFFRTEIQRVQQAIAGSAYPNTKLFMTEYNWMWNYVHTENRLFDNTGAVFYASMHKVIMETGLTGANNWNAKDYVFGLIDMNNVPHPAAYVFSWSSKYFVGTLVSSSSMNPKLEIVPVYSSSGLSVYVINKQSTTVSFALTQSGRYALGSGTFYNVINSTGTYQNQPFNIASLSGLQISPYTVWMLRYNFPPGTPKPATPIPATPKPATPKPATPKPATAAPSGFSYIGCYYDSWCTDQTRDLNGPSNGGPAQTAEKCNYFCGVRGYTYFGLQNYGECWCGNSYGKAGKAPETDCNKLCEGNYNEICGSGCRNSVYRTGSVGYIGCYVDNQNQVRDLPFYAYDGDSNLNIDKCRTACASNNYKYAALQYGVQCFCGNTYGSQGVAAKTDCNKPCSGDSTELCGAGNLNSIYTALAASSIPSY